MANKRIAPRITCIAAISGLLLAVSGCINVNIGGETGGAGVGGTCPDGSFSNKEVTGGNVSNLVFDGSWDVQLKVGDKQTVAISGNVTAESVKANISGDTLTLTSQCSQQSTAEVTVTTISALKVNNGALTQSSSGSINDITIDVDNGSRLDMKSIEAKKATVRVDNGSTADFAATDATVTMNNGSNGSAIITGTLDVDMDNGSNLTYSGGGTIGSQTLKNGSNLTSG